MSLQVVKNKKTPFCKVCFDAKKTESEYTSHYVRSAPVNGKIVCPTLLSQQCRYCQKSGHTVKFCSALNKSSEQKKPIAKVEKNVTQKGNNIFNILDSEEEDEEEEEEEYFPVKKPLLTGYAAACASTNVCARPTANACPTAKACTTAACTTAKACTTTNVCPTAAACTTAKACTLKPLQLPIEEKEEVEKLNPTITAVKRSWADWSDSEDEEGDNFESDNDW